MVDLVGQRFERLTVISLGPRDKRGKVRWRCLCDCGNETLVIGQDLKRGHTKSCGCLSREITSKRKFIDLTGQRFGHLIAIKKAGKRGNRIYWECRCDCGKMVNVSSGDLMYDHTKSCGCFQHQGSGRFIDIKGQRFGILTVLKRVPSIGKSKNAFWLCKCDCGRETVVNGKQLRCGDTKSCGCHGNIPGMRDSDIYGVWASLKARCLNPNHKQYKDYGGRGITVCDRWLESFENFFEDMGATYQKGLSIDRKDNDGPYSPDNCKWSTVKEQSRNRRSTRLIKTTLG